MDRRKFFTGVLAAGFVLMVYIGVGQAHSVQGLGEQPRARWAGLAPGALEALAASTPLSSTFSYQGVLKEDGQPVTGVRDMVFRLYADDTCTARVGSPLTHSLAVSY